jgi:hypothetical protein
MADKKPRIHVLGADLDPQAAMLQVRTNADGTISFFDRDGRLVPVSAGFTGAAYERPQGIKRTYWLPDSGESIGSQERVLRRFSRIVGVDTNYCNHDGQQLCVAAVCLLRDFAFRGDQFRCTVDFLWASEFRNPTNDPERSGWRHVLARGESLGWFEGGANLLLVVDAHLGALDDINLKRQPLIGSELLDSRVSLAYASADSGQDSPVNPLIRHCDRFGKAITAQVKKGQTSPSSPLIRGERTPFESHRYWRPA